MTRITLLLFLFGFILLRLQPDAIKARLTPLSAPVDYTVPGTIPKIAQPTDNTCWAATATMMLSWKDGKTYPITEVINKAGNFYRGKFDRDQGLSGAEKPDFLRSLRLRAEPPQSYSVNGWLSLLRTNGALWVTTNEGSNQRFAIHARIVKGIVGDGSADATFLSIIDPAGGREYSESVSVFTKKMEDVARADLGDGAELRPQVVHF
jgi:hypothetical protein